MKGVLAALVEHARARAEHLGAQLAGQIEDVAARVGSRPSFAQALAGRDAIAVIAECKRSSPSAGALAVGDDFDARLHAYAEGGAAAVSVLTEDSRFGGSYDDLARAARTLPAMPLLMKDFVVTRAQVDLAAHLGASAVLLIARCLPGDELARLIAACDARGLTPLIECHTGAEVDLALTHATAVIGVNNRDLDRLDVDVGRARTLLARVPADRVAVAESGYDTPAAVRALRGHADAVLVGSALMRARDPAAFLREARA